jgi:hypothetical protein
LMLASVVVTAPTVVAGASGPRATLVGTWRSDRERTLKHWSFAPGASPEGRAKIESWFGEFTYVFTARLARAEYPGGSWEARYRVRDESSNALTIDLLHPGRPEVLTLYFDEPFFFVRTGRNNFEYFRRIAA